MGLGLDQALPSPDNAPADGRLWETSQAEVWELARGEILKLCTKCKLLKPVSAYCRASRAGDGLHWNCKSCLRAYRLANPQKYADIDPLVLQKKLLTRSMKRTPRRKRPFYKSKHNPEGRNPRELLARWQPR